MSRDQRPEWVHAKNGMNLYLPFSEKNKDFLDEMKQCVPQGERKWDPKKMMWWISDAYTDEVDDLIYDTFGCYALGGGD